MPISVDWSGGPPWLITIPKSDLTLDTGTKYNLDVDVYWGLLRDFADSFEATPFPNIYSRIKSTTSTPSITDIDLDYYQIQFEDGAYSVNIINGNTNIREGEVKNTVSVNTNNTTGFIDQSYLEYGTFSGGVTVDVINGIAGRDYPIGTPRFPSNNIVDAVAIVASSGLPKNIYVLGDLTLDTGDNVNNYRIIGQNPVRTTLTVNPGSLTNSCEIKDCTVTGTLDGDTIIEHCNVQTITYFTGEIHESQISGTITLGSGSQADLLRCSSKVAGQATPTIDCGGSGQSLAIRQYSGGIRLINKTGTDDTSIDLAGGQVKLDLTTVTNGAIVVRGTGKVVDDSNADWLPHGTYGSLTLANETTYGILLAELWTLAGLDPDVPMTVTPNSRVAGLINLALTGDGETTTTVTRQ